MMLIPRITPLEENGFALQSSHINMYPILHLEHLFIYRKGKPHRLTEDFCEYISRLPSAWEHPTPG